MKRTAAGHPVVLLHYYADDDHTQEWAEKEAAKTSTQPWWDQEMEMRADAMSGQRIFPEFDEQVHCIEDSAVPKQMCRYMAIDPHPRTPHAFLWIGIDKWSDWYIYRELWPSVVCGISRPIRDDEDDNKFTIKEYAETIAVLEGNELQFSNANTDDEYAVYRRLPGGENIIDRYMDQAGKGFIASGEHQQEETYADRYYRLGIQCLDPVKSHKAGEDAVHELLKERTHEFYGKWPRLHVAASCVETKLEFTNLRYKRTKTINDEKELKQDPVEARRHLIDLVRYIATSRVGFIPSLVS